MNALVYKAPRQKLWEDVSDSVIHHSTDAIVKIVAPTTCGTGLHLLTRNVPGAEFDHILGHEGTIIAVDIGAVQLLAEGLDNPLDCMIFGHGN